MNAPDDKQFKLWLSRKMKTARQDETARVPYEQREGSGGGGLSDLMKLSREAYGWSPAADVEDIHRAYKDPSPGNLIWAALAATGPVGKVFKKGAKAGKGIIKAFHGTSTQSLKKILSGGVDINAPRVSDPSDFGHGFYVTTSKPRASAIGEDVAEVDIDTSNFAFIKNPYFLENLSDVAAKTPEEKLFREAAFDGGKMLTVKGDTPAARIAAAERIRERFLDKGYKGIVTEKDEIVIFDPSVIKKVTQLK